MNSELRDAFRDLERLNVTVGGYESFIGDALSNIGSVVKEGALAGGSAAATAAVNGLRALNTALIKNLGTRRMLLSNMLGRVNRGDVKEEITFPASLLKNFSDNGKPSGLLGAAEVTTDMFHDILKYCKDMEAFYHQELKAIEGITSIKNTEQAAAVLDTFNKLEAKFPVPKGADVTNNESVTWNLPGSRAITYNVDNKKFSFVSNDHDKEVTEVTESFAQGEFKELITKLDAMVSVCKGIADANTAYGEYLKKYNTVVGKASEHLSSLRGEVSASLLNDLGNRVDGNTLLFTFYTGFLAKVVIYLDDYVETLSSHLSKQFN